MIRPFQMALSVLVLLCVPGVTPVHAQYAETLAPIATQRTISEAEALWLIGSVSGSLGVGASVEEAPALLAGLDVIRASSVDPDRAVRADRFAFLLLRIEEAPPGFWFGLVPTPFTALHYLRQVGVASDELTPSYRLSGAEALDVTRRYLIFVSSQERDR